MDGKKTHCYMVNGRNLTNLPLMEHNRNDEAIKEK